MEWFCWLKWPCLVGVVLSNGVVLLVEMALVGVVLDGWSGPTMYQELSILTVIT